MLLAGPLSLEGDVDDCERELAATTAAAAAYLTRQLTNDAAVGGLVGVDAVVGQLFQLLLEAEALANPDLSVKERTVGGK